MKHDLEDVRTRLQMQAEDAAQDDETVTVKIGNRGDLPAWYAEISWAGPDGHREWTGYAGSLEDIEQHTSMQIAARKQRIDRGKVATPPPPPKPGDTIQEIRPNDPFKAIRH